jgi:hypothetical protein
MIIPLKAFFNPKSNVMKHLLLMFLLPVFCYGQGDQTIIKVPINSTGTTEQAILHLPDDYASTSTQYPVMVFLQGMGESGPNPASIYNSASAGGPAYFITNKVFPSSFVNPVDKKSYKYIVVSPQCPDLNSTTAPGQLDYVLTYLLKTYRIDASRIYLTGLSMGGGSILQYVGGVDANGVAVNATHKIAAFIPMSAVMNAYYRPTYAKAIVADNVKIWGFGSPTDVHGANTLNLVTWDINTEIKANYGVSTAYSGGHCCWGQFYDPSFTQNGMSIYQWALQYTTGSTSAPSVPAASAGSSQSITLPISQVTLSGAASTVSGGTISKYAWSQQSGPSTAIIVAAGSVSTSVTGLIAGTYVFKLTITDNNNNTATATIQITVNTALVTPPPVAGLAIPGKIEAEGYSAMSGIQTEGTSDVGGGQNVGWIDLGDWMDYNVNVATAGTYAVNFRIATMAAGAGFQLRSSSGTVLATVTLPNTGNYQAWQTVTASVTLPAGAQTLQLYSTSTAHWNINWMQFVSPQAIPGKIEAESFNAMSGVITEATTDVGRGLNVGAIDQTDWMDYTVNVATAGTYTVSLRIATVAAGAGFQLRSSSGTVLATVTLPNTGNYQAWQTVTASVTLPAGAQTLQLYSTSTVHWNINWMQFTSGAVAASSMQNVVTATAESLSSDSTSLLNTASTFVLYPNPVQGQFMIQLNNGYTGNMQVQIVDVTGVTRQVYTYNKTQSSMQLNLSAGNLSAGIYFVRVQIAGWSEVRKIIKQ